MQHFTFSVQRTSKNPGWAFELAKLIIVTNYKKNWKIKYKVLYHAPPRQMVFESLCFIFLSLCLLSLIQYFICDQYYSEYE